MRKALTGYVTCIYCGERYLQGTKHPVSARFVNGYPTVCEYVGKSGTGFFKQDDDHTPFEMLESEELPEFGISLLKSAWCYDMYMYNLALALAIPPERLRG